MIDFLLKISRKNINFANFKVLIVLITAVSMLVSCGIYKKVDARKMPGTAKERARQNIEEGKGSSIGGLLKNRGNTNFEFSSANPLWRASLETIDFMPLNTVDYSGGVIITDWYNDSQNSNEFIKVTIRFLSNEIRSDSLKILVHRKKCLSQNNCQINQYKSKIPYELNSSILKKAALLQKNSKNKK